MTPFGVLPVVGLQELVAQADLQHRFDVKFLVPNTALGTLVHELARRHRDVRVLEIGTRRAHDCRSFYFDTADLQLHRAQVQGRRRRIKVRTRTYGVDGRPFLELKARDDRGRTVKHRTAQDLPDPTLLGPLTTGQLAVWREAGTAAFCDLVHTATVSFDRTTLLIDALERMTIDRHVTVQVSDTREDLGAHWSIVETKALDPFGEVARTMRSLGYRPVAVSKYALALTAAHPHVRGNRWLHVLRQLRTAPPPR